MRVHRSQSIDRDANPTCHVTLPLKRKAQPWGDRAGLNRRYVVRDTGRDPVPQELSIG